MHSQDRDTPMKTRILKLLALVGLLASEAWYFSHPDWEPIITAVGLFASLIALDVAEPHPINSDNALYEKFIKTLPSAGVIAFIEQTNFGGAFNTTRLDPLRYFTVDWDNAEHVFATAKLERKRKELLQASNDFLASIALNTWHVHDNIQSVPAEWDEDQPERFERVVSELNGLAKKVVVAHQELVALARKRLRV